MTPSSTKNRWRWWTGAVAACAAAAVLFPSRWLTFQARAVLPEDRVAASQLVALESRGESGVEVEHDAGRGAWVVTSRAPDAESAERALAECVEQLVGGFPRQGAAAGPPAAIGPLPPASPSLETAAELLAQAQWADEAARALEPSPPVQLPAAGPRQLGLRGTLSVLDAQRAEAARARDAARLARLAPVVMSAELAWAREWAGPGNLEDATGPERAAAALRIRWLRRALDDRRAAEAMLEPGAGTSRIMAQEMAEWRYAELRESLGDPVAPMVAAALAPWGTPARQPLWPRGAAAAAAGGTVIAVAGVARGARRRPRASAEPAADGAADAAAWEEPLTAAPFHVVGGTGGERIAASLVALAERSLGRCERVLLVDGGERCALDRHLARARRWGLRECVGQRLPLLGLVQETGVEGLFLLARGEGARSPRWEEVVQLLRTARPHFDRVLVAVEPGAGVEPFRGLASLTSQRWWALPAHGSGRVPRRLRSLGANPMILMRMEAPVKELLESAARTSERAREERRRMAMLAARARVVPVESVLDCDLQVKERLRFLAWVRQVATESDADQGTRLEPAAPVSS
jgi:hypothetical protein